MRMRVVVWMERRRGVMRSRLTRKRRRGLKRTWCC